MKLTKKELHEIIINAVNETVNNTESNLNGCGVKVDYNTIYKNLGLIKDKK